jgi:hypothetical protein
VLLPPAPAPPPTPGPPAPARLRPSVEGADPPALGRARRFKGKRGCVQVTPDIVNRTPISVRYPGNRGLPHATTLTRFPPGGSITWCARGCQAAGGGLPAEVAVVLTTDCAAVTGSLLRVRERGVLLSGPESCDPDATAAPVSWVAGVAPPVPPPAGAAAGLLLPDAGGKAGWAGVQCAASCTCSSLSGTARGLDSRSSTQHSSPHTQWGSPPRPSPLPDPLPSSILPALLTAYGLKMKGLPFPVAPPLLPWVRPLTPANNSKHRVACCITASHMQ